MQDHSPKIPTISPTVAWPDLALAAPHLLAVQAIAQTPGELSGLTVPMLREKGLPLAVIRAVLRGVARILSARALFDPTPDLEGPLSRECAPGLRWVDLHLRPATFRAAARLLDCPAAMAVLSVQDLRSKGLLPRHLQEIFRAIAAYSKDWNGAVLPGRTAYCEELREWVRSRGQLPEALAAKTLPETSTVHPVPRRWSRITDAFMKRLEPESSRTCCATLPAMPISELLERGANPAILLELAESSEAAGRAKWKVPGMTADSAWAAAEGLLAAADSAEVLAEDPRMGALIRHIAREARNAADAARIVLELKTAHGLQAPSRALLIVALERQLDLARNMQLEAELADLVRAVSPARRPDRILERFGWSGGAPLPLETLSERAGISRERIRSLCRPLNRRPAGPVFAPALDRAVALLDDLKGSTVEHAANALAQAQVSAGAFHPLGVVSAANVFGRKTHFAVSALGGVNFLLPQAFGLPTAMLARARSLAFHRGAVRISQFTPEAADPALRHTLVRELAREDSFRWLAEKGGWFTLLRYGPHPNRALRAIEKMLSVTPALGLDEVRDGISRALRARTGLPAQILGALCELLPAVHVAPGATVIAVTPPSREAVLSAAELECVRVLERTGSTESATPIAEAWAKTAFSLSLMYWTLDRSPVLVRHGKRGYSLIGRSR